MDYVTVVVQSLRPNIKSLSKPHPSPSLSLYHSLSCRFIPFLFIMIWLQENSRNWLLYIFQISFCFHSVHYRASSVFLLKWHESYPLLPPFHSPSCLGMICKHGRTTRKEGHEKGDTKSSRQDVLERSTRWRDIKTWRENIQQKRFVEENHQNEKGHLIETAIFLHIGIIKWEREIHVLCDLWWQSIFYRDSSMSPENCRQIIIDEWVSEGTRSQGLLSFLYSLVNITWWWWWTSGKVGKYISHCTPITSSINININRLQQHILFLFHKCISSIWMVLLSIYSSHFLLTHPSLLSSSLIINITIRLSSFSWWPSPSNVVSLSEQPFLIFSHIYVRVTCVWEKASHAYKWKHPSRIAGWSRSIRGQVC